MVPGKEHHSLIIIISSSNSSSNTRLVILVLVVVVVATKMKRSNKVISSTKTWLINAKDLYMFSVHFALYYTNTLSKKNPISYFSFIHSEMDFSFYTWPFGKRPNGLYLYL